MALTIDFDPDEYLDFTWDWTDWLTGTDTITSQTLTGPAGVTVDQVTRDAGNKIVTAWVKVDDPAAVPSVLARVTCHIVTSAGRKSDRSFTLKITDR